MDLREEQYNKQFIKMTTEPVGKLLAELSVPTVISMLVTTVYNVVDTAFVGTLGTSESGATGIVFGYMAILQAIAFMCGQGAGSIMSRKLGAKQVKEATEFSSSGFFFSFFLGGLTAVISALFMEPMLYLLGSTKTILPHAKIYVGCIMASAAFFTSSLTMNNLLRYEGKAKFGTVGLMTGAVLNIGMDALLMFVFDLGILGAGISTAVSQLISWCILLSMFLRGKTQTKLSIRYVSRSFKTYSEIIATGFPSLLRQGLNSVATMLLNRASREFGDSAVAAMSVVSRVSFFPMAVAVGIGQGFQPVSAYNFGAGLKKRVKQAFKCGFLGAELALLVISIPVFIFAPEIITAMRDDSRVVEIGVRALRLMCIGQLFVPASMMTEMGFQSSGQKILASFGSSLRSGLVFIPVLQLMAMFRGLPGIQEAQPLSLLITFFICIPLIRIYLKRLSE